ncbi:MAG: hypothetical protein HYX56_07735 [Chloroflexi bacterium]|nr:hypothetical protein [Chloroflexota bacterium]
MARAVVDLDARATVLDAADRLARTPADGDVAFVVAAGAPLLRNEVFLEVLRARAAPRRVSLVTTDPRARSLASAVHVPAYASAAALERRELDPTERLTVARKAAVAALRTSRAPRALPSLRRSLAVVGSLAAALLLIAVVVLPEARVTVAAAAQTAGPFDIAVRAGPGGDITAKSLTNQVTAKVPGSASGSRDQPVQATGTVQLENRTTNDIRIPKETSFRTADGIPFLTTADASLPRSIIAGPFDIFVGRVTIGIQAAIAGPTGNVAAGRINVSPDPARYAVANAEPTKGGEVKKVPIVKVEDYDAALRKAPDALRTAAEGQLATWTREPRQGEVVVPQVAVRQTSVGPSSVDLVGKEMATFELTVAGIATAYAVADTEPKAEALRKVSGSIAPGNDVDPKASTVDVKGVAIGDNGITWQLTVRTSQTQRVDRAGVARLLAARRVSDAQAALESQKVRLVRLVWMPGWSPILPLLDARITVEVEAAPTTGAP